MRSTHSDRLEKWLGPYAVSEISRSMRGWYGGPIGVHGVPGSVWATGDGDFIGTCDAGFEASCADRARDIMRRLRRAARITSSTRLRNRLNVGFASLSDLSSKFLYKRQEIPFYYANSVIGAGTCESLWSLANTIPGQGTNTAAAAAGRACTSSTTGAMNFTNAISGEQTYVASMRGWVQDNIFTVAEQWCTFLLYDRLFDVAKTMSSVGTEAVTGVPTRYQGTTGGANENFAGSNFCFPEPVATLGSTVHNWTVCTYKDEGGAASTFPSAAGVLGQPSSFIDLATYQWFMPLAAGDVGISALTQMQCDASVTGTLGFVIGHPLVWFPVGPAVTMFEFEYVTTAFNMTRVFDNACLSFILVPSAGTTGRPLWRGQLSLVSA